MKLFEPFTINGKLDLKNRIVMPALVTRLATEEGEIPGLFAEAAERARTGNAAVPLLQQVQRG